MCIPSSISLSVFSTPGSSLFHPYHTIQSMQADLVYHNSTFGVLMKPLQCFHIMKSVFCIFTVCLRVYLCYLTLASFNDSGIAISVSGTHHPNQPQCMLWSLALSIHLLFLFWVCCCQKWQIWQNGDTFNLLVPMTSGRTHLLGKLGL